MVRAEDFGSPILIEALTHLADGFFRAEQVLRRHGTPADDVIGVNDRQLSVEIFATVNAFVGQRCSVIRRPTLENIADVDVFPSQLTRLDNFCQELPGSADKGFALFVFICARSLTYEHNLCLGITDSENCLIACPGKFVAASAGCDFLGKNMKLRDPFLAIQSNPVWSRLCRRWSRW